jgi:hypothetical protein
VKNPQWFSVDKAGLGKQAEEQLKGRLIGERSVSWGRFDGREGRRVGGTHDQQLPGLLREGAA